MFVKHIRCLKATSSIHFHLKTDCTGSVGGHELKCCSEPRIALLLLAIANIAKYIQIYKRHLFLDYNVLPSIHTIVATIVCAPLECWAWFITTSFHFQIKIVHTNEQVLLLQYILIFASLYASGP